MIKGFDKHTEDLSRKELLLVSQFVEGLNLRTTKEKAITNIEMRIYFATKGVRVADRGVRKIINYIRFRSLTDGVVIATQKGYYVSKSAVEISEYIDSLEERIGAIQAIKDNIQYYFENLLK